MNAPARPTRPSVFVQMLTLLDDTLLTQVITFVIQIGIAHLHMGTDSNYLEIFTSAATLGAAAAGARFDLSIALSAPGDEASARSLAGLTSCCVPVVSTLTTLIVAVAWSWVNARHGSAPVGWMPAVGVSILFLAQGQVCLYWPTRHRWF